jgi:hypothetical protein
MWTLCYIILVYVGAEILGFLWWTILYFLSSFWTDEMARTVFRHRSDSDIAWRNSAHVLWNFWDPVQGWELDPLQGWELDPVQGWELDHPTARRLW